MLDFELIREREQQDLRPFLVLARQKSRPREKKKERESEKNTKSQRRKKKKEEKEEEGEGGEGGEGRLQAHFLPQTQVYQVQILPFKVGVSKPSP